jgi:type IV pilus assembly protein PilN
MRGSLPINLSSDPFRRDRPVILLGVAGGTLLTALLAVQCAMLWISRQEAADTRAAIEQTRRQIQALSAEQARIDALMRRPENAEVIEYAQFYNELIHRKAVSWTRIFSDLDEVIPHNVRLVSIRPQIDRDNRVRLDMVVGSQTSEPVIQMLMKLEASPLFGATAVTSWLPPSQNEPLYRYRVTADYAPQL